MAKKPNSLATAGRHWPHYIAALEEPQFRWLLGGNAAFFLALQGQVLTRTFLAWDMTHQEMSLAYVNIAFALPMLILSMIGGAIGDRLERRKLVLIGQFLIVVNEAMMLSLLLLGLLEFWHMLIGAAVAGTIIPFIMPARTAIVFNVVGPKRLPNATALSSASMNLSRVLGPVIMGLVIDLSSVAGAYAVSVFLNLIAYLCVFGVKPSRAVKKPKQKLSSDVVQGFNYVWHHKDLLVCLSFGLVPMFLAMPFQNLLVVFADDVWHVGERGLGIMMASAGLGGVLGSIWMARRGNDPRRTSLMIWTTMAFAVFLILFAVSESFYLALLPLIIANIFAAASQTLNNTASQLLVEDEVRSRVSAIMLMTFGLTPLGVVPLAYVAQQFGVQSAIYIACVLLIASVILFYLLSPRLRRLDLSVRRQQIRGERKQDRGL